MNKRQTQLLQLISEKQKISVAELSQHLNVSVVTIRHDLNLLEKANYLKREHGFAVAIDDDDVESRMMVNFTVKQSLARYAASLVNDGDTVFIEGGSTNALLARLLAQRSDLTLITISTHIAHLLKDSVCEVILLGGILQKKTETMVGPLTRAALQLVHFNKSFIGIDGYRPETGFTGRDMMRADILSTVIQKSPHTIILSDSSKFGLLYPHSLHPTDNIHDIITDANLPAEYHHPLSAQCRLTLI